LIEWIDPRQRFRQAKQEQAPAAGRVMMRSDCFYIGVTPPQVDFFSSFSKLVFKYFTFGGGLILEFIGEDDYLERREVRCTMLDFFYLSRQLFLLDVCLIVFVLCWIEA